mgnify:CR=1 FL=1
MERLKQVLEESKHLKQAELSLDDGEIANANRYEKLFHISPDFIFESRIDDLKFTRVNKRACDFYGYSQEEFLNMEIFDIEVDAPLREDIINLYQNTDVGKIIEVFGHNKRKDGTVFPVHVKFTKIDDEFALANVRDLSVSRLGFVANLSKREEEVLQLIGSGLTPTEMSNSLNLSIKSVSTYRKRLINKPKLKNSIQLTQYAAKLIKIETTE